MGTSVAGAWERVVKLLQDLQDAARDPTDRTLHNSMLSLVVRLQQSPPPPKSTWKKLVQQLQVPMKLATAFRTAAQHSWKSPCTCASLTVLHAFLRAAEASGLIKNGAAAGNLGSSMRQQLQDSGALQQYAAAMAAAAADLRSEAATLGGLSSEELCSTSARLAQNDPVHMAIMALTGGLHSSLRDLWGSAGETEAVNSIAWLCDPSTHAEAAMQLCTAGLQHVSSVLQHVLPAVQQGASQQVAALLQAQQDKMEGLMKLGRGLLVSFRRSYQTGVQDERLQQLLLSPAQLPGAASLLVLNAAWASQACNLPAADRCQGPEGSSRRMRGSSASSSGRSSGSKSRGPQGGGSSSSGDRDYISTPCQLELLELLGLAALLDAVQPPILPQVLCDLESSMRMWGAITETMLELTIKGRWHSVWSQQQSDAENLQRWQFEQRVHTLLPAVLLPCANKLLQSPGIVSSEVSVQACVFKLLDHSCQSLSVPAMLHICCPAHSWCKGDRAGLQPPRAAWMEEVLSGVLELTDQLLLQQQQPQHAQAAATAAGVAAACSSTPSVPGTSALQSEVAGRCASKLAQLLSVLVQKSSMWLADSSSTATLPATPRTDAAAAAVAHTAVPLVSERFVEVCAALEAGVRSATAAAQRDPNFESPALIRSCLNNLFADLVFEAIRGVESPLVLHMGLRGPQAQVHEQRRLHSLLSTLQKLSRCQVVAAHALCWGQPAANACCVEVARAAVGLLQGVPAGAGPAGAGSVQAGAGAVPAVAVPAAAGQQGLAAPGGMLQQPAVDLLPSLVLLGRCFLEWAQQLQLLLATGSPAQPEVFLPQEVRCTAQGAACVCIPGREQQLDGQGGDAAATPAACELERLVAAAAAWVDGITCPAAQAALAAAAGGELQQFQQQLEGLSAAQEALREEDGVSTSALTALAQELQASGAMLCRIAVPEFCNNAACVNVSGPTEVQLVSGRSCLCAGCLTARYCGRVCQRQAWQQHKPVCKALAAAAAAAAAGIQA